MTDALRTIAASLLEAPEEATKLLGQGFQALGDALESISQRLDAIEAHLRGSQ
jgi:hypothetical protein